MADKYVDIDTLKYMLYDVHNLESLLDRKRFADHDKESLDMFLDSTKEFADRELFPYIKEMDEKPAYHKDGQVYVHSQVDKMMKEEGVKDNTSKIRELKHSKKIREQVTNMMNIKNRYSRLDKHTMDTMIHSKCGWLFQHYTNIFLKLKKNQISLQILDKFLETLEEIEEGKLDQHEGSVKVGQLLKELYIDSAMKNKEQIEERERKRAKHYKKPQMKLSWKQYKELHLNNED